MPSDRITFKTSGFRQLEAKLGDIDKKATRRTTAIKALKKGAVPTMVRIKQIAPKKTGLLRSSIDISDRILKASGKSGKKGGKGGKFGDIVEVYIGIDRSKGPRLDIFPRVLELGSLDQPATPFFRPGFEQTKFQAVENIKSALVTEIELAVGRQTTRKNRR